MQAYERNEPMVSATGTEGPVPEYTWRWERRRIFSKVWLHGIVAGRNVLRFTLTIDRGKNYSLSVLPCRNGKLMDWEKGEIRHAFGMVEPVRYIECKTPTYFLWEE